MANEFFAAGGSDVAITITPGESGVLQVFVDGEKIFDKKEEGGHPTLDRVKKMKAVVKEKLAAAAAAGD
jgi:predicted Rdx family selenoprotein